MTEAAGRVIAGTARGTRLIAPVAGVRPLGDRVKQSVFAMLEPELRGGAFLDLFAGSGAAGIEALSRGASRAVFVERDLAAFAVIERNLAATHLAASATVIRADATSWLRGLGLADGPFRIVFADPPYDAPELLAASLEAIATAGPGSILEAAGVAVSKHSWRRGPPATIGLLASARDRRFGETRITFHRWEAG